MSSRYTFLCRWSRLLRVKGTYKSTPMITLSKIPKRNIGIPYTLGFSIFTWLGFQNKLSAEDELIQTIKHCVLFIQKTEYEKAEQLLHVALRQAQQMQHQLGITYIYDVMANLALERRQLDKAKQLFIAVTQRIMMDGANEDDLRVIHISVKLARISHLKREYDVAQLGYDWCLKKLNDAVLNEPTDDTKKLLAIAEDWYGRLFIECNQYEQGLKLMISALKRMKEVSDVDDKQIVVQLNDIGTCYDHLGKIDDSISYIEEAIEIGKHLPDMEDLGTMYVNLGRAFIKKNLLDAARKNCGFAWKLGADAKNDEIKHEAELCIKEIKNLVL